MADIAFFIGALVPTFFISRLILWTMRGWQGAAGPAIYANLITFLLAVLVAGYGLRDGNGNFEGGQAAAEYSIPCLIWLAFDLVWRFRQARRAAHDDGLT
jgi:hypothetical protein